MKTNKDQRLELLERLTANVRITLKHADPETVIFAGGILRDLAARREELAPSPDAWTPAAVEAAVSHSAA